MTMTRVINMRKEHMEPRIGDLYPDPPTDYRVKIEIVATDDQVEQFVKIIQGVAGKHPRHNSREYGNEIFIFPVDEAIRIRTGETGDKAI
jgi:nitrogen regulatory protein PII